MSEQQPTNNKAATAAPRTYSTEDFKKWGAKGGKGASRADKVRAARIRWDKAKKKKTSKAKA